MKHTVIFLILTIFFLQVSFFLLNNHTPWDKEKLNRDLQSSHIETNTQTIKFISDSMDRGEILFYLNTSNFIVFIFFFSLMIIAAITSMHTFLDKLFFKKFYEEPDWKLGIRRGVIFSITVVMIILLRLLAFASIFTVVPLILLSILGEYVFTSRMRMLHEDLTVAHDQDMTDTTESKPI